jgi:hypothetical protein
MIDLQRRQRNGTDLKKKGRNRRRFEKQRK